MAISPNESGVRQPASRTRMYVAAVGTGVVAQFVTIAVGLWLTPLTLHYLDRERYAVFALAQDMLSWLALIDIGISGALSVSLARLSGRPEPGRMVELV